MNENKKILNLLKFLTFFSFSTSYETKVTKYLLDRPIDDFSYQEYDKANDQHLYSIVKFIEKCIYNKAKNSRIFLKTKNYNVSFLITNENGETILEFKEK